MAATLGLTGLGGYVWLTGRATEAGQRVLDSDQVELLFLDAMFVPWESPDLDGSSAADQRKAQLVAEARRVGGNDPYVLFQVAYYHMIRGSRTDQATAAGRALEVLDAATVDTQNGYAFSRLRKELLSRMGRSPDAAALDARIETPSRPLDHYAAGEFLMLGMRHQQSSESSETLRQALHHARRAVALSVVPRSSYLLLQKRVAMMMNDEQNELLAVDALAHHWPRSAVTWAHRAMSYLGKDDQIAADSAQRSLRLKPDNLFGIVVEGQLAERRGELTVASKAFERARKLYPRGTRYFQLTK